MNPATSGTNLEERHGCSVCKFCDIIQNGTEAHMRHGSVVLFPDAYPVSPGHHVVAPIRHVVDFFDMSEKETHDLWEALHRLRAELLREDPKIDGFNVGTNCGIAAGQTILHAHVHLIPRRFGDTSNPRGGVRGVIPEQQSY
ncbi:HIT family protein [Nonomuraea sp. NPDC047897]|uniref:HIT family protein n=1 Tax=Nonomuraea sp. NPDC047897 TaxID=3364346 RepID=UPI003721BDDF